MQLAVAEALLFHAIVRREELPPVAVRLLESGIDTPTVRELAGLNESELSGAHELFRRVLQELERKAPTLEEAAETLARHLASRVLAKDANLRAIAADGAQLAASLDYHTALMPFYAADDDYGIPEYRNRSDVERELVNYARQLVGNEVGPAA